MRKMKLTLLCMIFMLMSCYSQDKKTVINQKTNSKTEKIKEQSDSKKFIEGGTAKQFLDGYAWQNERGSRNFMIFHKTNDRYYFEAVGSDDGTDYDIKVKNGGKYYFYPRSSRVYNEKLGYDEFKPVPLDSIYNDYAIRYEIYKNDTLNCEVYFDKGFDEVHLIKNRDQAPFFILGFNIKDRNRILFDRSFMRNVSNILYWKRITSPPKFVQDFIISLKKDILVPILVEKSTIYSEPNQPTMMYLIKGDEVECLEEKGEWYKIRYYGKKTIEGWIRKSDVE